MTATPGPIPIARNHENTSNSGSDGTPRVGQGASASSYMGLSASLGGGSFREAMALSFGKDVADLLEYTMGRFSSSTDSDVTVAAPSSVRLESTFCRNFTCCGRELDDLHDLLQHYEECHVRFEDDDVASIMTDEELETSNTSDDLTSNSRPGTDDLEIATPMTGKPPAMDADVILRGRSIETTSGGTPMVSTANEDLNNPSAFNTAVMRSPSTSRGTKRSLAPTSLSTGGPNALFRAVIENGGRHPLGMSSAFSASPFSSPGSSRPGTPGVDTENEAFFGSTTQTSMFSNLSLRSAAVDDQQPSCAPPNLFFPSASQQAQRPSKRERFNVAATASSSETPASASSASVSAQGDPSAAEHRPYKCPAPGCDKAYKQMNGLKYHRLHGHCNQNLRNVGAGVGASANDEASAAGASKVSALGAPGSGTSALGAGASTNDVPLHGDTKPSAASLLGRPGGTTGAVGPGTPAKSPLGAVSPFKPVGMASAGGSSPGSSAASATSPSQERETTPSSKSNNVPLEKAYVCQVGNCDKRYKNLNGLRYHYLHSGSHGLLGLQLLHANGGGASAKADSVSGRPPVSTDTLSREQIVQAAAAAQALLNQQNGTHCVKNQGNTKPNLTAAAFLASMSNGSLSMANAAKPM